MEIYEVGYVRDGAKAVMHRVGAQAGEALSALDPEPVDAQTLARVAGVPVSRLAGKRFVTTREGWRVVDTNESD